MNIFRTDLPWLNSSDDRYLPTNANRILQQYDRYAIFDLYLGYQVKDKNLNTNTITLTEEYINNPFLVNRFTPYNQPQVDLLSEAISRCKLIDRYKEYEEFEYVIGRLEKRGDILYYRAESVGSPPPFGTRKFTTYPRVIGGTLLKNLVFNGNTWVGGEVIGTEGSINFTLTIPPGEHISNEISLGSVEADPSSSYYLSPNNQDAFAPEPVTGFLNGYDFFYARALWHE